MIIDDAAIDHVDDLAGSTVEETHWSVKMPQQMTFLMPRLCRTSRKFVPVSAESAVFVTTDFITDRLQLRDKLRGCPSLGSRLFQPGIFATASGRAVLVWHAMRANRHSILSMRAKSNIFAVSGMTDLRMRS